MFKPDPSLAAQTPDSQRPAPADHADAAYFARFAPATCQNGYSVIAVQPRTKKPANEGGWKNCGWWRPSAADIGVLAGQMPDAGVGLACGRHTMAFDIDLENAEAADRLVELVTGICGPTPLIRVGKSPKIALVYRSAEPIISIRTPLFDILGFGCQLLAYGYHPEARQDYRWIGEGAPHRTALADVPAVTQDQCIEVASAYMRRLYGDRFQRMQFGVDSELMSMALSSRTTLIKQLATCLFRGKAAAQSRIRREVDACRIPAGMWGLVMRPQVEGCADYHAIIKQMRLDTIAARLAKNTP